MATRPPCPSCPWRVERDASTIPGFRAELIEGLRATGPDEQGFGPDLGAPMFGCHQSREGEEFACAGWLAVCGSAHPGVRIAVLGGDLPVEALRAGEGWPELEPSLDAVIDKLRRSAG